MMDMVMNIFLRRLARGGKRKRGEREKAKRQAARVKDGRAESCMKCKMLLYLLSVL